MPTFVQLILLGPRSFSQIMNKAVVIGAGVGGLSIAIRLARKGYDVDVFEAAEGPGGKLNNLQIGGYRFDAGPSLFTMPHLVEELFTLCEEDPAEYFPYQRLDTACHYFYPDGTFFKAYGDRDRFVREANRVFGIEATDLYGYLDHCQTLMDRTGKIFLEKSLHDLSTWLSSEILPALAYLPRTALIASMNTSNRRWLKEPHLVQLFNRYATYNGSDPYQAPGILQQIASLEQGQGSFFPKGGMYSITRSLYELGQRQGVKYHFNQKVSRILHDGSSVHGVELANGEKEDADVVASNMDIVPTYRYLLPDVAQPKRTLQQERSSSALIFYWGIKKQFPELDLHNIFFSADYRDEFHKIFKEGSISDDPTIYVHISSKLEPGDAPSYGENWFIMVNVPHNSGQDWDSLYHSTRTRVIEKLSLHLGVNISELIEEEDRLDPVLIEKRTFSYKGALYGASSNDRLAAFFRHPNFKRDIKGLYFVGGSVHPGGGVPLCLLSARIASDYIPEL